jgi:RimJ/RimL family protein N-acetyltransferase
VIELRGDRVLLRGFRPEEVDIALERMQSIPASELDAKSRRERRERIEHSGERAGSEIMLAIEAEGRLVGDVQGRCPRFAMPPGVWELGIEVWEETDRGRGFGTQTVALLSAYLFEHEDAIRVQATTDVDNAPMRGALERLGFAFEGVLHGYMPDLAGPPRDYAMYGLTEAAWNDVTVNDDTRDGQRDRWTPTS